MSGELISQETVDALIHATNQARHVIGQAHEATRDLRQVVTEARGLIKSETEGRVREEIEAQVAAQLRVLARQTKREMDRCVAKVGREFSRLERLFLGLENDGKPSMETLIRQLRKS